MQSIRHVNYNITSLLMQLQVCRYVSTLTFEVKVVISGAWKYESRSHLGYIWTAYTYRLRGTWTPYRFWYVNKNIS